MQDVVVTGYGIISPIGNSMEEFERRMFAGDSGIRDIRGSLVDEKFPAPYAGVVDDCGLPTAEALHLPAKLMTHNLRFQILASLQALEYLPSGLSLDGIVYGTGAGVFFEMVLETYRGFNSREFVWGSTRAEWGLEHLAAHAKARGNGEIARECLISINSACATGIHSVGLAYQFLRTGRWRRCLAGAVDSGPWSSQLMNYYLLNALTTAEVPAHEASKPFSKDRSGFVKSEASAALVLETGESARERGAEILAEVCGFGLTSDAYRLTDGREDNLCACRAMEEALETAGVAKEEIDYISAHGTSTPLNDLLETKAIKRVFGDRAYRIPISSLKSQIGHPTVASGMVETLACVLMLQRQRLAPTINLKVPDPECDLDYVPNRSRHAAVQYILNNSFGFGGQNACLVLKKGPGQ